MKSSSLNITILGSGTSTGIPVVGCNCSVCRSTDPRNRRTRCSALLSYAGRNILIDTSPDLRLQALRENICHIDAVLYTHSHADHLHGIDDLRGFNLHSENAIPLFSSNQTLKRIRSNFSYIFDNNIENPGYVPRLSLHPIEAPFELFDLTIIPIPLQHGRMQTLGFRCGPLAYLTDCNEIPENSLAQLENLELLILDGLRFRPHSTHFNITQAVEIAKQINARQTWLTHLSHEVDHPRHNPQLPDKIDFAYDGQRQTLQLEQFAVEPMRSILS